MRKATLIAICLLAVAALFVACKSEPVKTSEDGFLHAQSFLEFEQYLGKASNTDKKTVVLDKDIVWDGTKYDGKDGKVLTVDATGLTIDLGGHKITEVPINAFNLTGSNFTLKNGTINGAADNNRYSVNINYNGTNASTSNGLKEQALAATPKKFDDTDKLWKNRINVENITATGMLCGYSTVYIKNCSFIGGPYRGLVLQGSSGIVENVTCLTAEDASSAGFVAHSYGTVIVRGTCSFKGKFGVYSANCAKLTFDAGSKVTAAGFGTYAIYGETQGSTTVAAGATLNCVPASSKVSFYLRSGASVMIEKDATVNASAGTAMAKPIPAAEIDAEGNGSKDADWAGYGSAAGVTDKR